LTATDTLHSMLSSRHEGNIIIAGCYAPFLGPVSCTQSIVLTAKGGSAVTGDIFNVSHVFSKKHTAFK